MSQQSSIEWTDATWNPVRGCVKISPGCKHCYAETFAERWRGIAGHPYEQGFDPRLVPDSLDAPLHWKKPRTIFVNSMSDLFGAFVPSDYIAMVFGIMAASPQHRFQVLTKRAERMREWTEDDSMIRLAQDYAVARAPHGPKDGRLVFADSLSLSHIHLGVSVEDRKYGLPRIEHLRNTAAAVRFLSIEPLLEDLGKLDLTGIHWAIVGGESGVGAREMSIEWVRSIRDQCAAAGVPFFFKQWGGVRKKAAGRLLDGRTWDQMPQRTT